MAVSLFHSSLSPFRHSNANQKPNKPIPPISISTNPSHLNPHHLQNLFVSSNFSCHRFPLLSSNNQTKPADTRKLKIAIAHSFVVVSVFVRDKFLDENGDPVENPWGFYGSEALFERIGSGVLDEDYRLVGFGRAVSDGGLTASIHDVVVMPSLRRLGIGRKIVGRILRGLTCHGIYDISALCSEKERLFFEACGFGEDSLGSTTMIYTRTARSFSLDNLMIRCAGRMILLIPPPITEWYPSRRIIIKPNDAAKSLTESPQEDPELEIEEDLVDSDLSLYEDIPLEELE